MPRVKTFQRTITNNSLPDPDIDKSIVHSRSMSRSDLITSGNRLEEINELPKPMFGLQNTDSSTSASVPIIRSSRNFNTPVAMENLNSCKPDYDICQKLEDFVVKNTPRQLTKTNSSVTPSAR